MGVCPVLCPIVLNSRLFLSVNSQSLCALSDVPVTPRHPHGCGWTPSHDRRHDGKWDTCLKHASATGVPQVVKSTRHARASFSRLPCFLPAPDRLCRVTLVYDGRTISRRSVAFGWKNKMVRITSREQTRPETQDCNGPVIEGQNPTGPGIGLAMTDGKRAGIEINLPPPNRKFHGSRRTFLSFS